MTNICFDCKNALGGCSWSAVDEKTGKIKFILPDGCKAKPTTFKYSSNDKRRYYSGYEITQCPLFEEG